MKTYKIELRTDLKDDEKDETIKQACRDAARQLFTTATLISTARPPMIALSGGDFFEGEEEIVLVDEEEGS